MATVEQIKQLRERTGAGMTDCQKALVEANDDFNVAIEVLRKKGLEKAGKKAERTTKEGVVALAIAPDKIAVVTLACETDFVARTPEFVAAVQGLADELLTMPAEAFAAVADTKIKNELIVKVGENMQLGAHGVTTGKVLGSYLHSNRKVAAVVALDGGTSELAADIAMHVTAMSPKYLNPEDVPAAELEKEKEIYRAQLKGEGKPDEIIEKALGGKVNKFYAEACLLKQQFIKDEDKTIEQLLNGVKITSFARYQV